METLEKTASVADNSEKSALGQTQRLITRQASSFTLLFFPRPRFEPFKGYPVPKTSLLQKPNKSTEVVNSNFPSGQNCNPLPLDWILDPAKQGSLFDHILAHLIRAEAHETDPHLRDDYRIAWLTVRFCQTGEAVGCTPHVLATYKVLGCHPEQVWYRMNARRAAMFEPKPIRCGAVKREVA